MCTNFWPKSVNRKSVCAYVCEHDNAQTASVKFGIKHITEICNNFRPNVSNGKGASLDQGLVQFFIKNYELLDIK